MLSCKEIVQLISSDVELTFMKRAELKVHLMMCKHCSRYSSHLKMITHGFKKLFSEKTKSDPAQVEKIEKEVIEKVKRG